MATGTSHDVIELRPMPVRCVVSSEQSDTEENADRLTPAISLQTSR